MNIFVLQESPIASAADYCNKHLPKMCVELLQMCGSAVIRHGATPDQLPLTKAGTPLRGGYHNHPVTRWVGDTRTNFLWAVTHGLALCYEYSKKYGKTHFCEAGIRHLDKMADMIPEGDLTPFALAMPDEYRPTEMLLGLKTPAYHASGDVAVQAYRRYYHSKEFASWEGRPIPTWWSA
ncbi:MAG: hypothetical protein CMF55_00555 [Legionellales bacterium]|nr:hypothetical protein [Legionellales bacterium]